METTRRTARLAVWLLFAVYLVLLAWIILFKLHEPFIGRDDMREIKLVPFVPSGVYHASSPGEVIANLLFFVPFGVYLRTLTPWKPWLVLAVIALSSAALEVMQFVLAAGSSDLTDVIVNTAGGAVGVGVFALVRRRFGPRTAAVVTSAMAVVTVLVLVAAGLQIASFPRMTPGGGPVIIE